MIFCPLRKVVAEAVAASRTARGWVLIESAQEAQLFQDVLVAPTVFYGDHQWAGYEVLKLPDLALDAADGSLFKSWSARVLALNQALQIEPPENEGLLADLGRDVLTRLPKTVRKPDPNDLVKLGIREWRRLRYFEVMHESPEEAKSSLMMRLAVSQWQCVRKNQAIGFRLFLFSSDLMALFELLSHHKKTVEGVQTLERSRYLRRLIGESRWSPFEEFYAELTKAEHSIRRLHFAYHPCAGRPVFPGALPPLPWFGVEDPELSHSFLGFV